MAQKRGFNFSLARHYDKAIAAVMLLALLASLFELATSAADSRERTRRYEEGVANMRPKHPVLAPQNIDPFENTLRNLHHPETVRASTNEVGLFIPQHRVWCVDCMYPILYSANECPFCQKKQPVDVDPKRDDGNVDREGKGIPDKWRIKHFNHPFASADDHSRAEDDADDDGFTNLQEYQSGSNPRDPKDHPDLMFLLRFKEITTRPYPFTLSSASIMPGGSLKLTFKLKNGDSLFVNKGAAIGKTGMIYSNCVQTVERVHDPKIGDINVNHYEASLFRPTDGKSFLLKDNDVHAAMEQETVLTITAGGKTTEYHVSAGSILELESQKYKVDVNLGVDDKPVSVVLENILTGKKSTVNLGML